MDEASATLLLVQSLEDALGRPVRPQDLHYCLLYGLASNLLPVDIKERLRCRRVNGPAWFLLALNELRVAGYLERRGRGFTIAVAGRTKIAAACGDARRDIAILGRLAHELAA